MMPPRSLWFLNILGKRLPVFNIKVNGPGRFLFINLKVELFTLAYSLILLKSVADQDGESQRQVQRYIRLTELIPELMDMVDEKKIALNPAYELSFLKKEEQTQLLDAMDSEQATPSLSQAQRLKKFSQEGHLSIDVMRAIMGEEKKSDLDKVTFTSDTLRKYFPKSYTPQRMQETIIKLLEAWQKKRQRDQER